MNIIFNNKIASLLLDFNLHRRPCRLCDEYYRAIYETNIRNSSNSILANIFLIEFLRKFGKGSEDSLWSQVSQGQDPFERSRGGLQSSLPKTSFRFLMWFLGVLSRCKKSELFIQRNLQQHDLHSFYNRE